MGGLGSGRPSGSGRDTVEACRSLDVNRLHREGCLRAGWVGGWQWSRDGEQVASISLRAEADRLHLTYRVRIGGGDWEDVAETVRIVRVACRFGGARPYFVCPGVVNGVACGRRVAKLHLSGRYFLCRHCHRLGHASQSEDAWDRAFRRANKIRQRLGGDPGMAALFPPRPKGMWRRTYKRLFHRTFEAEMEAEEVFAIRSRTTAVADQQPQAQTIQSQKELLAMSNTEPLVPVETAGTAVTRFNALRHGVLSRYTVLPWEDAEEYHALVAALVAEHAPQGPTEEHLVEELAGILWRKRRLRLAEAAAHRRGLDDTFASYRETVKVALAHLDAPGQSERVVDCHPRHRQRHGGGHAGAGGGRGDDPPRPRHLGLAAQ